ncbi:MAG: DNA polymerase IV [Peptoniphilus sp.]|nr:DNA polymerase IV [Peptoniphilus sp.]MDY3118278.1 DNA polymerase IV [Peptoniphilus sp.]
MQLDILHVDMDAFFASVEILLNPALKNKPLAVGGKNPSGIVTTASYEARKYGVHSAMPMFMAKSLCPNLIVTPTRKGVYGEMSRQVFSYLASYGYLMEQVSIDEAYFDLTTAKNPVAVAKMMQREVASRFGLSMSCGLSYNKFLAKIASDREKPHGFTVIGRDCAQEVLASLPISKIHGVGEKTAEKLKALGVHTGADLMVLERDFLYETFGKMGMELYDRVRGEDRRKVEPGRKRKSIGTETTFSETREMRFFKERLMESARQTAFHMEKKGIVGYTVTVKLKTADFHTHTKSKTFHEPVEGADVLFQEAWELFCSFYGGEKLRLLGLSVSGLEENYSRQLRFL